MSDHRTRVSGSTYDKSPEITVPGSGGRAWAGWDAIGAELLRKLRAQGRGGGVVAVECNSAVDREEVFGALSARLRPGLVLDASEAAWPPARIECMVGEELGDDRVFGRLTRFRMEDMFDPASVAAMRARAAGSAHGPVLVYGPGATLMCEPDIVVYVDMARREIELRYRDRGEPNWLADNCGEEFLRKYKRGYFFEWRVMDRHKRSLFARMDYVLDTNRRGDPAMVTARAMFDGLSLTARRPFRVVPYFDPGPWGGQWMKEVCDLDRSSANYAWCFDCVPEENSLYLTVDGIRLEIPSVNLVYLEPRALLGDRVHARFGLEFPIRFDFLDTMGGGNLSLQVHPLTEYIQEAFGMHYTQDESYYILDAGEDASVYLGVKNNVSTQEFKRDLVVAQEGGAPFPAERYVNRWPARKHDHFLIPGGTVHCSGRNTMVLEISATPYIFTFKLWDWGRLGLDGRPRPIHLEHGFRNIQWDRDEAWTAANLLNRTEKVAEGPGWTEERTGLHEREFLETRRHWFEAPVALRTGGGVNVLNLVDGDAAIVESPGGAFEPFEVHYAETFIVPASAADYAIRPAGPGRHAVIRAYVRG